MRSVNWGLGVVYERVVRVVEESSKGSRVKRNSAGGVFERGLSGAK